MTELTREQLAKLARRFTPEEVREALRIKRLQTDLSAFCQAFWHIIEPSTKLQWSWHMQQICEHLQAVTEGRCTRLLINIPPRHSKPVDENAKITTARGLVALKDVVVGDRVLTHRGRYRRVTAVHLQGALPLWEIKTHGGRTVRAAGDHPFLTARGWVNAQDLVPGSVLGTARDTENDLEGMTGTTPEECRLAGYFVGDGNCTISGKGTCAANVTCADPLQVEDMRLCAKALGFQMGERTASYRYSFKGGVRDWLRKIDLYGKGSHTKRIPHFVMQGGLGAARHFLGAYFACDGTMLTKGKSRTDLEISFTSVNRALLEDTQHLLSLLGIRSRIRERATTKSSFKEGVTYYVLQFSKQDDVDRFRSQVPIPGCKQARFNEWPVQRQDFDTLLQPDHVISVAQAGEGPCRCLTVEEDETFHAEGLIVHNSSLVSVMWPAWEWATRPGRKQFCTSYAQNLLRELANKMLRLIESPEYQAIIPERFGPDKNARWELDSRQSGTENFANTEAGIHQSATIMGQITGKGGDCFAAGTLVSTPTGKRPIEALRAGDLVWAFDHSQEKVVARRVVASRVKRGIVGELATSAGKVLRCTHDHRIFSTARGDYVPAGGIYPQELLGRDSVSSAWKSGGAEVDVYDIQVEGCHNFFAEDVLVHNCVIIDDPMGAQDVRHPGALERVIDIWTGTLPTRLNDLKTGAFVVIMQRLHENDLAGHILQTDIDNKNNPEWKPFTKLIYPSEYDPELAKKWDVTGDPRTKEGELLCPERFGTKELAALKVSLKEYGYGAQHGQDPVPRGAGIFDLSKIVFWYYGDDPPPPLYTPRGYDEPCKQMPLPVSGYIRHVQSWDMAFKETEHSDFVCGQYWVTHKDALMFLIDQVCERADFPKTVRMVEDFSRKHPLTSLKLIEDKANGPAVISTLQKKLIGILPINPEGGKEVRANAASEFVSAQNVVLPHPSMPGFEWVEKILMAQMRAFPKGKHDDAVDTLSQAVNHISVDMAADKLFEALAHGGRPR